MYRPSLDSYKAIFVYLGLFGLFDLLAYLALIWPKAL